MFLAGDAPGSATSILENAIQVSKNSEAGLDDLWMMTFTGSYSPGYLAVMDFAQKIMVIPFFWLFIPITRAFTFNRYEEIFKHVAWLVLVAMLTVNNYGLITQISYGARNFVNDTTLEILSFQLGPVTMQDALSDVLLTQSAKKGHGIAAKVCGYAKSEVEGQSPASICCHKAGASSRSGWILKRLKCRSRFAGA